MDGRIHALYRHPVKGFTPERLDAALLEAGDYFPCDRLYAVEQGPCGFDPAAPTFIPKSRFAVLATLPALARAVTAYDEASAVLRVAAEGRAPFHTCLAEPVGCEAFAPWLMEFVDPAERRGPVRVLQTAGAHRFTDDLRGAVSTINLASLRDLEARLGRPIDPRRFRANLYLDGWPAWAELDLAPGTEIELGEARARVVKPIVRCAATHVDPTSGVRDIDLVPALHGLYGRMTCGLYLQVDWGGRVAVGDPVRSVETSYRPPAGETRERPSPRPA